MEIWTDIEGYLNYQVSNMGRVKSLGDDKNRKEKILKGGITKKGYLQVVLCKDGKTKKYYIHRLVAQAFIPNPNNLPQVNHRNEDKTDNRVDNLEWCDGKYNNNYGTKIERQKKELFKSILQFTLDGEFIKKWDSTAQVEKELGIKNNNICNCLKGRNKTAGGYIWHYHYKSIWIKKHIPQIKLKKVA